MSERGECARILRGNLFGECEHIFLTLIHLLSISLTRVKEIDERKRVQGDSKSPCRSPGLCALCTYGPKVFREAASLLFLGAVRMPNSVGRGLAPAAASRYPLVRCTSVQLFAPLPVELPAVFAVLFEAAKAKFLLCYNRVVFLVTREDSRVHRGATPMRLFFGSLLWGVPKK